MSLPIRVMDELENSIRTLDIPTRQDLDNYIEYFASEEDIDAFKAYVAAVKNLSAASTFRAMRGDGKRTRHCARCHDTYTEVENSDTSCTIPHFFSSESHPTGDVYDSEEVYSHKAWCCPGIELEEAGSDSCEYIRTEDTGMCFVGRHTDDVFQAEDSYNKLNIVPCNPNESGSVSSCGAFQLSTAHKRRLSFVDEVLRTPRICAQCVGSPVAPCAEKQGLGVSKTSSCSCVERPLDEAAIVEDCGRPKTDASDDDTPGCAEAYATRSLVTPYINLDSDTSLQEIPPVSLSRTTPSRMQTEEPPCPEWEPLTDQGRCPATPSDDIAFTAGSTFSWRKLRCGINPQGNHYCTFEFYAPQIGPQHTYRYYNANGSYYYRASNSKGFFFHPGTGMRHISSYDEHGAITGREYLPAEDEDLMDSLADALPKSSEMGEDSYGIVEEREAVEY